MNSKRTQSIKLMNLDLNVYKTGRGHMPSDFGVITVTTSKPTGGYAAYVGELVDPSAVVFGLTPALAYTSLIEVLIRDADMNVLTNVLEFTPMPEVVRPAVAA